MSSQMVLFGQMLINKSTAICQFREIPLKPPFPSPKRDAVFFLFNGLHPTLAVC